MTFDSQPLTDPPTTSSPAVPSVAAPVAPDARAAPRAAIPVITATAGAATAGAAAAGAAAPARRLQWTGAATLWLKRGALVAGTVLVVVAATGYGAWSAWSHSGAIAEGTTIAGEAVGGLDRHQAKERLLARFGHLALRLQTPDRAYWLGVAQCGGEPVIDGVIDKAYRVGRDGNLVANALRVWRPQNQTVRLMLPLHWDSRRLKRALWTVALSYNHKPRDASLQLGDAGMMVVPETVGRTLHVDATLADITKKYYVGLATISATVDAAEPRVRAADLAGTDCELGTYRTSFDSGLRGRTRNIHVAVKAIDGIVLMPGQSFSFNKSTGERTWDKGYRMAKIFEHKPGKLKSEVVDGLAGGVCQVSTTLYNAVRRTNLKRTHMITIIERNTHSLPVHYVPKGFDATVAWPGKDLRFRNKFSFPIYLRIQIVGERLSIGVWGRVPAALLAQYLPKPTLAPAKASLQAGSPATPPVTTMLRAESNQKNGVDSRNAQPVAGVVPEAQTTSAAASQ